MLAANMMLMLIMMGIRRMGTPMEPHDRGMSGVCSCVYTMCVQNCYKLHIVSLCGCNGVLPASNNKRF